MCKSQEFEWDFSRRQLNEIRPWLNPARAQAVENLIDASRDVLFRLQKIIQVELTFMVNSEERFMLYMQELERTNQTAKADGKEGRYLDFQKQKNTKVDSSRRVVNFLDFGRYRTKDNPHELNSMKLNATHHIKTLREYSHNIGGLIDDSKFSHDENCASQLRNEEVQRLQGHLTLVNLQN